MPENGVKAVPTSNPPAPGADDGEEEKGEDGEKIVTGEESGVAAIEDGGAEEEEAEVAEGTEGEQSGWRERKGGEEEMSKVPPGFSGEAEGKEGNPAPALGTLTFSGPENLSEQEQANKTGDEAEGIHLQEN